MRQVLAQRAPQLEAAAQGPRQRAGAEHLQLPAAAVGLLQLAAALPERRREREREQERLAWSQRAAAAPADRRREPVPGPVELRRAAAAPAEPRVAAVHQQLAAAAAVPRECPAMVAR